MSAKRPMKKKDLERLEKAAKALEKAAADAFAALWYFQHDAWKGHSWGYAARQDAEWALGIMKQLFPMDEDQR